MRYIKPTLLVTLLLLLSACASFIKPPAAVKVMSFNIRCGFCEQPDSINHWSKRKILVADLIRKSGADIIGFQEAERFQITDLVAALPEYDWYGIGRDDGGSGEMNAILVRKSRFEIINPRTIHLSPTPNQVSIGWDARYKRTLTMAKLRDKATGQEFNFFNSHFDHIGTIARFEAAKIIVSEVQKLGAAPVILTGDFNDRPGFDGYLALAGALNDAAIATKTTAKGGDISFNGFGQSILAGNKIDYIFASKNLVVNSHEIITKLYNGNYPSDHFALLSEIEIPTKN